MQPAEGRFFQDGPISRGRHRARHTSQSPNRPNLSMAEAIDEDDFEAELERELQDSARQEEERHSIETLRSRNPCGSGPDRTLSGQSESSLIDELAVIEQEAVIKHPHFNRKAKKKKKKKRIPRRYGKHRRAPVGNRKLCLG